MPAVGYLVQAMLDAHQPTGLLQVADKAVIAGLGAGFGMTVLEAMQAGTPVVTSAR